MVPGIQGGIAGPQPRVPVSRPAGLPSSFLGIHGEDGPAGPGVSWVSPEGEVYRDTATGSPSTTMFRLTTHCTPVTWDTEFPYLSPGCWIPISIGSNSPGIDTQPCRACITRYAILGVIS